MKAIWFMGLSVLLAGCVSTNVRPIDKSHNMSYVCIEDNPNVRVPGLVETVMDVFHAHGIRTELYRYGRPSYCYFTLVYSASMAGDYSRYLARAQMRMFKGREDVGYAEYLLKGDGGLSPGKWDSVESKIAPLVNELLVEYASGVRPVH